MTISPSKARALCTESEYNLVKWSSPRNVKTLTPAKLKEKITRTRKLRDKFRDLASKQRGEERGKRKPSGTRAAQGNDRTVMKAELFAQTLSRFEDALKKAEKREGASSTPAKKTTKKAASKSSSNKTTRKASTGKAEQASPSNSVKQPVTKTAKKHAKTAEPCAAKPSPAKQKSSAPASPIALGGPLPASRSAGFSLSLGGGSSSNNLTDLFSSARSTQESRESRRKQRSQTARMDHDQSRFASSGRDKMKGHVSAQARKSQAKGG